MANVITSTHLKKAVSYETYRLMINELLKENKTTGTKQSDELTTYTRLNVQRMNRLDKTIVLTDEFIKRIAEIKENWVWLVLSEGWCGDAAQSLPILYKMAQINPHIDFKILLRDENLDIMDAHLTDGGRSIPKLICLDANTLEELWDWGPRPAHAQKMVKTFKANPTGEYQTFIEQVHLWYTKDKGQSLQNEIMQKMEEWQSAKIV